jgi:hypothetical protein
MVWEGTRLAEFTYNKIAVFNAAHPHTIVQTIDPGPGGSGPESIVLDAAGNFYVGQGYGDRLIR